MSKFMICHMQKFKMRDVKGLQIHNQREKESHSNSDIIQARTEQNYDLIHDKEKVDYKKLIQNRIDNGVVSNRAIRKDAVVCCSFMISASPDYMNSLSQVEQRRFFEESLRFLKGRYGEENFVYASVHVDEKTPHMHVGMVPVNEKQKLSAYSFFKNKSEFHDLQDKIYEHVKEKGFDIERGVSSDRKHLSTQRFKAVTLQQEIEELEQEKKGIDSRLHDLKMSLDQAKSVDEIPVKEKGGFIRSKTVEITSEDFESIKVLARSSEALREDVRRLKNESGVITREKDGLYREKCILEGQITELKRENRGLKEENDFFKKTLERVKELYKEKLPELAGVIGYVKGSILDRMNCKFLKRYFTSDDEVRGAQKFLNHKQEHEEQQKRLKQVRSSQQKNRDQGLER
ncbi:plasmid recombination enzyme [Bacillus thuringiensis serovar andalousiensis]|uniref:MobV family relaxase n=1 Tax=Bacillus cereus group TaxID=86661 RepID=UPI0006AC5061|nr:MobV family relaxase [Bacillus thuringiensis]MCQ3246194.1 plasmid recombination protein [Salmonella enterica subsp. enterica serovar Indiana]MDA2113570.1 plasmid recombination protein [Bacillus cereus]MDA2153050.1 plasmid recombination protein [Bacillus cereus]MEB8550472.1 MobV family relaxase [Bacillus cereus]MEB8728361.1 MobV family relaxase [Bacillus cereus]